MQPIDELAPGEHYKVFKLFTAKEPGSPTCRQKRAWAAAGGCSGSTPEQADFGSLVYEAMTRAPAAPLLLSLPVVPRRRNTATLAPSCGPSARDTRPAHETPLAVADPAARPSAPRPSPATPYAALGGWAVA